MEVPWMQPFFSFPKVWFALPMAGAQEAGHRRLQRIALFRGLGVCVCVMVCVPVPGRAFSVRCATYGCALNDGDLFGD